MVKVEKLHSLLWFLKRNQVEMAATPVRKQDHFVKALNKENDADSEMVWPTCAKVPSPNALCQEFGSRHSRLRQWY